MRSPHSRFKSFKIRQRIYTSLPSPKTISPAISSYSPSSPSPIQLTKRAYHSQYPHPQLQPQPSILRQLSPLSASNTTSKPNPVVGNHVSYHFGAGENNASLVPSTEASKALLNPNGGYQKFDLSTAYPWNFVIGGMTGMVSGACCYRKRAKFDTASVWHYVKDCRRLKAYILPSTYTTLAENEHLTTYCLSKHVTGSAFSIKLAEFS